MTEQQKTLQEAIEDVRKAANEVMLDEIFYGIGGYCLESNGSIGKATQEELYEALTNSENVLSVKNFTPEEILDKWKETIDTVYMDKQEFLDTAISLLENEGLTNDQANAIANLTLMLEYEEQRCNYRVF